ncbi:MAG: hypothetical protein AAGB22_05280, partial [Bacteroidota bacterium]
MAFGGGFQSTVVAAPSGVANGAVFITDIVPTGSGNVGGKQFSADGKVLVAAIADTDLIRVFVLAQTGHSNYRPNILVLGQVVALAEDEDQTVWTGYVDVDRQGAAIISAIHEDGSAHSVSLTTETGPEVLTALFTGGYPGTQTELKQGDRYDLTVTTDAPFTALEVDDADAAQAEVIQLPAPATQATITVTIADRGVVPTALGIRLRAQSSSGSFGSFFDSATQGQTDGLHTVVLNNAQPSITVSGIAYPQGQSALKGAEVAVVNHQISAYDQVAYQSLIGELSIVSPNAFAAAKVVSRSASGYNVATPNLRIAATRLANGATATEDLVVQIADAAPTIAVQTTAPRLRSGGTANSVAQQHPITVVSDQLLAQLPAITAPAGTLQGMTGNLTGTSFTETLEVRDSDPKGAFNFGLLQATNLAGVVATTVANGGPYVLGGFVPRTIKVPRFEVEVNIGTEV